MFCASIREEGVSNSRNIPASGSAGLGGASGSGASGLRSVLIVALVVLLGVMVAGGAWVVVRQRKRGMMGGDENEDDVEYSRLVTKGSRTEQ